MSERLVALACLTCMVSPAQMRDECRLEITASLWSLASSGTIQSGISPVDIQDDLGITGFRSHFSGSLGLRFGERHQLIVEGTPYRLDGDNTVARQFTFGGRTYIVEDRVVSSAEIQYVAAMYQYDLVRNGRGSFSLGPGIAYINAFGEVQSTNYGFTGNEEQAFAFPLAGASFRAFPAGPVRFTGAFKGMSLGDYGYFFQGEAHGGVDLGRYLTILAGYRFSTADVHRRDQTTGISLRFSGPVFSLQLRR